MVLAVLSAVAVAIQPHLATRQKVESKENMAGLVAMAAQAVAAMATAKAATEALTAAMVLAALRPMAFMTMVARVRKRLAKEALEPSRKMTDFFAPAVAVLLAAVWAVLVAVEIQALPELTISAVAAVLVLKEAKVLSSFVIIGGLCNGICVDQ